MGKTKPTTGLEIKHAFVEYFKKLEHVEVPSSSLIPADDLSLLFTSAGMVQFKRVFLGKETRPYSRAVTIQRCFRATDLENVGYTLRHHTFFEMLGNFSFGDYFKRDAISYAWRFLTEILNVSKEKLWVTVHEKDIETAKIWHEEIKIPADRIGLCGDADNFWAMGETGPCGYCSEIYYDHGENLRGAPPGGTNKTGDRFVEIWNLVFMQFDRDKNGKLNPLPKPSIDTGMGFERIAAVQQGVHDNYATEDFISIMNQFEQIVGKSNKEIKLSDFKNNTDLVLAKRIVADHVRAVVFLIADGVLPSNEGRGYVLRSIIRRALYHLYKVGVREPCLFEFADTFVNTIGKDYYPELKLLEKLPSIKRQIITEETKFLETLDRGVKILDKEISKLSGKTIPGDVVFNLHDTYGFPVILTAEIAKKKEFDVDQKKFETLMEEQKQRSRRASKFVGPETVNLVLSGSTEFVGYDKTTYESKIFGLLTNAGKAVKSLNSGEEGIVVLLETPFYAESGGQVGDIGEIVSGNSRFMVTDTKKEGTLYLHYGKVISGILGDKDLVTATIDIKRRQAIKLNHTAAHLLHKALQLVLGEDAAQRGSLVTPERLRFDYAHAQALKPEEIERVEKIVNEQIRANHKVITEIKSLSEAKAGGAVALFDEKYGDKVRVVKINDFSQELCGGTHIKATGEIGVFKIIVETAVAAGVRRIEALTGDNAFSLFSQDENELRTVSELIKANRDQLLPKFRQILEEKRLLDKELLQLKGELAKNKIGALFNQAVTIGDIKVLAAKIDVTDNQMLRQAVDALKQKLQNAVIVLAAINDKKIQMVVGTTKAISEKFNANLLLQHIITQLDGSGGGRAEMAQGAGTKIANLDAALASVIDWVKSRK